MAPISKLESDLVNRVRAGIGVTCFHGAVAELVANAVDACPPAASCAICVELDVVRGGIRVEDDCAGLSHEDMVLVGQRYCTSKTARDGIRTLGHRGEALASLATMCLQLRIVSRVQGSFETFVKVFQGDTCWLTPGGPGEMQAKCGTVVTVQGFMHNQPVRLKRSMDRHEQALEKAVWAAFQVALPFTHVQLTIKEVYGKTLLELKKLYIAGDTMVSSDQQLVYVNGRLVSAPAVRNFFDVWLKKNMPRRSGQADANDDTRQSDRKQPAYLVFLSCPRSDVLLSFELDYTVAAFKSSEILETLLQDCAAACRQAAREAGYSTVTEQPAAPAASSKAQPPAPVASVPSAWPKWATWPAAGAAPNMQATEQLPPAAAMPQVSGSHLPSRPSTSALPQHSRFPAQASNPVSEEQRRPSGNIIGQFLHGISGRRSDSGGGRPQSAGTTRAETEDRAKGHERPDGRQGFDLRVRSGSGMPGEGLKDTAGPQQHPKQRYSMHRPVAQEQAEQRRTAAQRPRDEQQVWGERLSSPDDAWVHEAEQWPQHLEQHGNRHKPQCQQVDPWHERHHAEPLRYGVTPAHPDPMDITALGEGRPVFTHSHRGSLSKFDACDLQIEGSSPDQHLQSYRSRLGRDTDYDLQLCDQNLLWSNLANSGHRDDLLGHRGPGNSWSMHKAGSVWDSSPHMTVSPELSWGSKGAAPDKPESRGLLRMLGEFSNEHEDLTALQSDQRASPQLHWRTTNFSDPLSLASPFSGDGDALAPDLNLTNRHSNQATAVKGLVSPLMLHPLASTDFNTFPSLSSPPQGNTADLCLLEPPEPPVPQSLPLSYMEADCLVQSHRPGRMGLASKGRQCSLLMSSPSADTSPVISPALRATGSQRYASLQSTYASSPMRQAQFMDGEREVQPGFYPAMLADNSQRNRVPGVNRGLEGMLYEDPAERAPSWDVGRRSNGHLLEGVDIQISPAASGGVHRDEMRSGRCVGDVGDLLKTFSPTVSEASGDQPSHAPKRPALHRTPVPAAWAKTRRQASPATLNAAALLDSDSFDGMEADFTSSSQVETSPASSAAKAGITEVAGHRSADGGRLDSSAWKQQSAADAGGCRATRQPLEQPCTGDSEEMAQPAHALDHPQQLSACAGQPCQPDQGPDQPEAEGAFDDEAVCRRLDYGQGDDVAADHARSGAAEQAQEPRAEASTDEVEENYEVVWPEAATSNPTSERAPAVQVNSVLQRPSSAPAVLTGNATSPGQTCHPEGARLSQQGPDSWIHDPALHSQHPSNPSGLTPAAGSGTTTASADNLLAGMVDVDVSESPDQAVVDTKASKAVWHHRARFALPRGHVVAQADRPLPQASMVPPAAADEAVAPAANKGKKKRVQFMSPVAATAVKPTGRLQDTSAVGDPSRAEPVGCEPLHSSAMPLPAGQAPTPHVFYAAYVSASMPGPEGLTTPSPPIADDTSGSPGAETPGSHEAPSMPGSVSNRQRNSASPDSSGEGLSDSPVGGACDYGRATCDFAVACQGLPYASPRNSDGDASPDTTLADPSYSSTGSDADTELADESDSDGDPFADTAHGNTSEDLPLISSPGGTTAALSSDQPAEDSATTSSAQLVQGMSTEATGATAADAEALDDGGLTASRPHPSAVTTAPSNAGHVGGVESTQPEGPAAQPAGRKGPRPQVRLKELLPRGSLTAVPNANTPLRGPGSSLTAPLLPESRLPHRSLAASYSASAVNAGPEGQTAVQRLLLGDWQNPVKTQREKLQGAKVLQLEELPGPRKALGGERATAHGVNAASKLVPGDVTKDMLDCAVVLGQVDRKFVALSCGGSFVIADQHAVDERIRLEALTAAVLAARPPTLPVDDSSAASAWVNTAALNRARLQQPQVLSLSRPEAASWHAYRTAAETWGWRLLDSSSEEAKMFAATETGGTDAGYGTHSSFVMSHVPEVLGCALNAFDLKVFLLQMSESSGSDDMPDAVQRLLKSKACRYAVMFGDMLGHQACQELIRKLRDTRLWSSCAHGRPTMAPIVDLDALGRACENEACQDVVGMLCQKQRLMLSRLGFT